MLATIRIARILSPEGYGQYNLVQAVAGIGVILAGLGFRNVIIREVARHPEQSAGLFSATLLLRLPIWIIVGTGVLVYAQFYQRSLDGTYTAVIVGLLVGISSWELIESIAFGQERMEFSAGINLAGSVLWCVVAWAVPIVWITPLNVSLAFMLLQIIEAPIYLATLLMAGSLQIRMPSVLVRRLLYEGAPFYWLALLTMATSQLPVLFLAERSGRAEVGLYNVGYRLVNPMQMLIMTALTALYPGLSQIGMYNQARFKHMIVQSFFAVALLGTVGAFVVSLLRGEVVLLLFGTAYLSAAGAMGFQAWYIVFFCLLSLVGTTLAASDHQYLLALLASVNAVLSVPLLWIGSAYGATGLAASMCISMALGLVYHWLALQRVLMQPMSVTFVLKLVALLVVGMTLSWSIPQALPLGIRVALATAAIVVLGIVLLPRVWPRLQLARSEVIADASAVDGA